MKVGCLNARVARRSAAPPAATHQRPGTNVENESMTDIWSSTQAVECGCFWGLRHNEYAQAFERMVVWGEGFSGAESFRLELQSMIDFPSLNDSISIKSCLPVVDNFELMIALRVEDLPPAFQASCLEELNGLCDCAPLTCLGGKW